MKILETLNNVARRLGESVKHQYYILIDDLDRNWQNTEAQNAFIAALFSSLRTFNRPPNIKCVVAVREKIYRALPLQDRDKLHDSIIEVRWNADAVREMINARVTFKFNAPANEIWGKMFPSDAFQEIWKHSMGRPRKAIRLTTLLIEQAVHEAHLTAINEDLRAAICKFSDERLIDVTGELQYTYPSLERFLRRMTGWKKEFDYAELKKLLELVCLKIACAETNSETYKWILTYEPRPFEFAQLLVENGLLLFKPSRSAAAREYDSEQSFETTNDSWFAIHPMFGPALGLVGA